MTSTNKPKKIALCLILLFTTLGITLANATTEDNYKNNTQILPRISESTHTENGYKANIIINPYATGIYAEENGYNTELTIIPRGIGGKLTENNYQLDLIPEKTFPYIPDLAVTNVTPSKTIVGQGYTISIEATVKNKGFYFETFNVIAYANTTIIDTLANVTLTSGTSTTVTFTWNTTGFAKGNYTISANATTVPGETNTADNNKTDGWVVVTILGDINGDRVVDVVDLVIVALALWSEPGDENWNPCLDLNQDGIVDIVDLTIVAIHLWETW